MQYAINLGVGITAFERGMSDVETVKEYHLCVEELIVIEIQMIGVKSDYILNLLKIRKEIILFRIKTMFEWHKYSTDEISDIYHELNNKEEDIEP